MKTYTAVVERSPETGLFVGFIRGCPGAHTQAESLDELNARIFVKFWSCSSKMEI
jgi:predicted RNase H-like HicB family nuclease